MFKQTKATRAGDRAREAIAQGHTVLVHRHAGGISGAAESIEEIEAAGWRLDKMDWFFQQVGVNGEVGIFLFRR